MCFYNKGNFYVPIWVKIAFWKSLPNLPEMGRGVGWRGDQPTSTQLGVFQWEIFLQKEVNEWED